MNGKPTPAATPRRTAHRAPARDPVPRRSAVAGAALALALLLPSARALAAQDESGRRASDARVKGTEDAPVTVFELADFECPFCRRFTDEVMPRLDSAYVRTGKVRWVYVNYPLPIHARAWPAAEAAMCVGAAGGDFWSAHDALFARQDEWAKGADAAGVFAAVAAESGADAALWSRCVEEDLVAPVLVQDLVSAAQTGASGTPAFIIDQRDLFVGIRPFEEWVELLDAALARAAEEPDSLPPGG